MRVKKISKQLDQSGAASLLFSMIMLTVISLIVLGFAQLARRGQTEVLNSQLSNQAYYAAESGVNDTIQTIANVQRSGRAVTAKSDCQQGGSGDYGSLKYNLNSDSSVKYTCVMVNPNPGKLVLQDVGTNNSSILNVEPTSGLLDSLTITWRTNGVDVPDLSTCPRQELSTTPVFKPASGTDSWNCQFGVMRIDLVPIPPSEMVNRGDLLDDTLTVFVVPTNNTAANEAYVAYSATATQQGLRGNASCKADDSAVNTKATCSFSITNLNRLPIFGGAATNHFALRLMSKYVPAGQVSITGSNGGILGSGFFASSVTFQDGQAVLDVTGKAQNVLRRLQVRVPLSGASSGYMDYAISSQDSICKRFRIGEGGNGLDKDQTNCPSIPN